MTTARQELEGRAQELRGKLVTRESQMAQVWPRLGYRSTLAEISLCHPCSCQ